MRFFVKIAFITCNHDGHCLLVFNILISMFLVIVHDRFVSPNCPIQRFFIYHWHDQKNWILYMKIYYQECMIMSAYCSKISEYFGTLGYLEVWDISKYPFWSYLNGVPVYLNLYSVNGYQAVKTFLPDRLYQVYLAGPAFFSFSQHQQTLCN